MAVVMLIRIDSHSGVPIYRQLIEQIRWRILTGDLVSGDSLPSVRDLASLVRVNPMTVSKAYALLEHDGLVERRRGVGLFVRPLGSSERRREVMSTLRAQMREAALSAIDLGLSEAEGTALFREILGEMRHGGESNER